MIRLSVMVITVMQKLKMKMDKELNEYLECVCGRCDDGICRCCESECEYPQTPTYDDTDYEEYIEDLNDWD